MKIDAHQHFWNFDPVRDAWITDDMKVIQKDFLPDDLEQTLVKNGFDGCVAVQADQSEEETLFLLEFADQYEFIGGVVGWIDLRRENIQSRLGAFAKYKKLKGFRHIVQAEPDDEFLLGESFCKGIGLLGNYRFTYDILIKPHQLNAAIKFVEKFPNQLFVIDHLAKPFIKDKMLGDWKKQMHELGQFENVSCKISGMVTEADWKNWKTTDFKPYIDHVIDSFGTDRVMFGSDWPVCLNGAPLREWVAALKQIIASRPAGEQRALLYDNAIKLYGLTVS